MSSPSPNLLFIFTDEQRYDTLACYGNTQIEMPNLNRLADESTIFEQAYVTQPLCTPARATLMTGQWPHTVGCTQLNLPLPTEARCLPELLRRGRYRTGYHGKWHLGDEVFAQHGFEDWQSTEDGYAKFFGRDRDSSTRTSYHHWLLDQGVALPEGASMFSRGFAARLPEPQGKPAFLAESASRFIREQADEPWLLCVNFLEPHMPFFGPRDDLYDPASLPLPPNFDAPPTDEHPLKYRLLHRYYHENGHSGLPLRHEAEWRRMIANYWGLCSLVDTHVGGILDTLRASGQWDDTIIVFTSDHGDMMASHQLLAKTVMYEESVRVPMLIKNAGQRQQRRVHGPVSHIDLVPTLLELMGQPAVDTLPGKSLTPLMQTAEATSSEDVFIMQQGPSWGIGADRLGQVSVPPSLLKLATQHEIESAVTAPVRTVVTPDGWKFNCSARHEHELYHLANDPYETRNLAKDATQQARIVDLTQRIHDWQVRVGDPFSLSEAAVE